MCTTVNLSGQRQIQLNITDQVRPGNVGVRQIEALSIYLDGDQPGVGYTL
jgi:hypothetical protein